MSLLKDSTGARVEARLKAAEKRAQKQRWLQMLGEAGVDRRFALEIHNYYNTFPTVEELESLWDTEVGQEIRDHFDIEYLRIADAFKEFGLDPDRAAKMLEGFQTSKEFIRM